MMNHYKMCPVQTYGFPGGFQMVELKLLSISKYVINGRCSSTNNPCIVYIPTFQFPMASEEGVQS